MLALASLVGANHFPTADSQGAFRLQHHNIESLVTRQPCPLVHLHARDALARGIQDGYEVYVVSARGKVPFRARLTADIQPGVVEVNTGGGGSARSESLAESQRK